MTAALKAPRKRQEFHIQQTCDQWLELDGWRVIVTDPPHLRGLGVMEPGMADRLYIRYWSGAINQTYASWAQVLWIEWKAKGGTLKQHQQDWHETECARGALTLIAGQDFPKTIEGFQEFYRSSGLMRRKI